MSNTTTTQKLEKGDVIWVPYRSDPMWPALVQNVYPKKVVYCFFPLPSEKDWNKNRFSCAPKLVYALVPSESLPDTADDRLITAFNAASSYLNSMGKARGADIESIGEAETREKAMGETQIGEKRMGKRKRGGRRGMIGGLDLGIVKQEIKQEIIDEEDEQPALKKSVSDRPSPSGTQTQQPLITEEQSQEMMNLIDIRLQTLFNEIWKSAAIEECRRQRIGQEMTIKLRNNQFLIEPHYRTLFDRISNMILTQNPSTSMLEVFSITATVILPKILIKCYSEWKNVDLETAKEVFYQSNSRVLGLDPSMSIPVTDHLEQLCQLACNESDAILG